MITLENAIAKYGKDNLYYDIGIKIQDIGTVYKNSDIAVYKYRFEKQTQNVVELWKEFGEIPMNPETECIESEWNSFPAGTHREEIWHWFEETFDVSVAEDLMGL